VCGQSRSFLIKRVEPAVPFHVFNLFSSIGRHYNKKLGPGVVGPPEHNWVGLWKGLGNHCSGSHTPALFHSQLTQTQCCQTRKKCGPKGVGPPLYNWVGRKGLGNHCSGSHTPAFFHSQLTQTQCCQKLLEISAVKLKVPVSS
jgi:hypothetical protein